MINWKLSYRKQHAKLIRLSKIILCVSENGNWTWMQLKRQPKEMPIYVCRNILLMGAAPEPMVHPHCNCPWHLTRFVILSRCVARPVSSPKQLHDKMYTHSALVTFGIVLARAAFICSIKTIVNSSSCIGITLFAHPFWYSNWSVCRTRVIVNYFAPNPTEKRHVTKCVRKFQLWN